MENFDLIILTIIVAITFLLFIISTIKEFNKMTSKPYTYKKEKGIQRATLFNLLSSFFEEKKSNKKKLKKVIERTISDMEDEGVYFKK
jgi:hypothetical protein